MPFNETAVFMEKPNKHDTPSSSSSSNTRENKLSSPTVQCMGRPIDNPLIKYQGCKWEQVFDFDRVLKQIRNAERYYFRGKYDHVSQGSSSKSNTGCSFPRREQPQVQRLSSNDMHFYGMVPKQPFDVVVCDICLGIYTKMGFNNHMKLHHPQAWNLVSSKTSSSKESGQNTASACSEDNIRDASASVNLVTEQTTVPPAASNSRHKSSKSSIGSSGGSSRSRSKSKHHHHHHNQQPQQSQKRSSSASAASSHSSQTSTANAEVSINSTSGSKSSKKATSGLSSVESKILSVSVPKDIQQSDIKPVPLFSSSTSSSSVVSLPPPSKQINADACGAQQDSGIPSTSPAAKEKPKASKRKSKNISVLSLPPPESNESSNSSVEYTAAAAAAAAVTTVPTTTTTSKSSSKRSKPKGKDLKQLMEPQLSELDKAISSITAVQTDAINETSNSNDNDCGRSVLSAPITSSTNTISYNTEDTSLPMSTQVPIASALQQQQQKPPQYGSNQIMTESTSGNIHHHQHLPTQRSSNAEDNDNSILTLEDVLDSKFIHEILNTDESEIHFDENELDKVAQQQQQQQQQQAYMQPTANKRMRYDDQIGNGIGNVENVLQQTALPGKYAAFQQHQQQQQTQQAFHVANLEDIKMYTTAIDAQQYLAAQQQQQHQPQQQQQQEQHQITTIDPMQLQQLLYQQQQQQQQGLNPYAVGTGLDDVTAALEQQHYNDSDVIMCSAEQLHKEGKINAADYATLAALSGTNNAYSNVPNNVCDVNAMAAAAQFQVYNIPSLTDDDIVQNSNVMQNHYVLPAEGNDEEQLIYEITANNQVAVISRQQQMIAEFLTQAGYDSVDNVNVNLNSNAVLQDEAVDSKFTTSEVDINDELLDFDYSRLDTVKSCSSSSSISFSADSKGLPRPMAVNSFGLCKLPQGVATTFRKNLHATRKANNSPISLNGNGGATARFSSNGPNAKSTGTQNYFTALGAGPNAGNMMNEFSIGSITITNQTQPTPNSTNLTPQQQQQVVAQKQALMVQTPIELANGLITTASATSPPVLSNARSSRPKSAGIPNSGSSQSKQKFGSNSLSSNNATILPLPQNQAKTIIVNANNAAASINDQTKFIKRSLIAKTNLPARNFTNFTAKQLSDMLLHPSKEKYLQLLSTRDRDGAAAGIIPEQRLTNVRNFYERRKRLLSGTVSSSAGYNNNMRQHNNATQQTTPTSAGLKQKFLRQRLLRTLSDCGNSIKTNSNSATNSSNNDILRVS